MKQYYLVTTQHLENRLWFRDDKDFAIGMNYVAIQASISDVIVLAFILMSNHVHFILYGTEEEVRRFIRQFKIRFSLYSNKKYGTYDLLRRNDVDMKVLSANDPESLERAIAYVLMNCVAASICAHPSQYPWGTGNLYFNTFVSNTSDRRLGPISPTARARLLHSKNVDLPENWIVSDLGFIKPESYVRTDLVENIFRRPERMNYFLQSSSKARKRLETIEKQTPAFRDQTILKALPELCLSLFQKQCFTELSASEQSELMRQIRFRFSANVNQIARVCGVTYAEAAQIMDTV